MSAEKAQIYKFEFELSTLRGFQATFHATGVGVHPPLMTSQSKIDFETPLYDSSRKQFSIRNEHFDKDQYKHPVPRIGPDGTIFPVGPTSFSIQEPDNSGLVFSPCVGTIKPGEEMVISGTWDSRTAGTRIFGLWKLCVRRSLVKATYCPTLNESEIENKMNEYTIKAGFQINALAYDCNSDWLKQLANQQSFENLSSLQQHLERPQGRLQFVPQGGQVQEVIQTHAIILMHRTAIMVIIREKIHHIGWQEPI